MTQMFYDFQTRQQVNPLEKIDWFIIDPHQPENYKLLKISQKVSDISEVSVVFWKDMPTVVLPIELLKLGVSQVHFNEDFSGKIITQNLTIYFHPTTDESIIRITTVICR